MKIYNTHNTKIWFSSDWHLFHENIIKYSKRPFTNVAEMNNKIVENWNSLVSENDICFFLGDFAFPKSKEQEKELARIVNSLKGREKHFINGNHDKKLKTYIKQCFTSISDYLELEVNDTDIVMSHYPFLSWNKSFYGSWMLHGHCHGTLKEDPHMKRVDVGIDCWKYSPVSFDVLKNKMDQKLKYIPAETVE